MIPDLRKLKALTDMPPLKSKRNLYAFLGILSYLSKFCPITDAVCKALRQLAAVKTKQMWRGRYQKVFNKEEVLMVEIACMKF